MSTSPRIASLFDLLPAFYRQRDAQIAASRTLLTADEAEQLAGLQSQEQPLSASDQALLDALNSKAQRGPLQSLMMVLDEQLAILAENNQQFYDDLFIETCAPWVVPYIGDLVGYQALNGIAAAVASPRAEVAQTISFRRRKGTLLVLEQLAQAVTAWGAHAVEFYTLLATTQYMNHVRPQSLQSPDLRSPQTRALTGTGFDPSAHTIDVRRISTGAGRYNIRNIGIFLWPVSSWPVSRVKPLPIAGAPGCFRFNTVGRDVPLYNRNLAQVGDITSPSTPLNVPRPLTRIQLCSDLIAIASAKAAGTQPQPLYYGDGLSVALYAADDSSIDPSQVVAANLSGPDGSWQNQPVTAGVIAIDPELGRLAVAPGEPIPSVSFQYGFSAGMGGGPYSRVATFTGAESAIVVHVKSGTSPSLEDAIASLNGTGIVEIDDSEIYSLPSLAIAVGTKGHIELRAADQQRPTLLLSSAITITGDSDSILDMNGFLIAYDPAAVSQSQTALLHVPAASTSLGQLNLTHLTLVPGGAVAPDGEPLQAVRELPALLVETPGLTLNITSCITGGLVVDPSSSVSVNDSVIDATDPRSTAYAGTALNGMTRSGGMLSISGTTVIGKVYASLMQLISNSVIDAAPADVNPAPGSLVWLALLWSARRQQGCIRFSYLPAASILPPQYECVVAGPGSLAPAFASLTYGDPDYVRLNPNTPAAIRTGASDGGEMGAFHSLLAPLREADLRTRLSEYATVAMEYGVFYQS